MSEFESYDAIVVGAGVAGLTAAAELTRRRVRTLVVERHNVAGGCASFYQRDGYRFDVGATLVGGFGYRGVHRLLNARLGIVVSAEAIEPSMIVHLPDLSVARYGDTRWNAERVRAFGASAEPFWHAQEYFASLAWDFSSRLPAPPVDLPSALATTRALRPRHAGLAFAVGRSVASILPKDASPKLKCFVDAQLLITAQTDAAHAQLAYGATALDLAREGTFHLRGGVSAIAVALARSVRAGGSSIRYDAEVASIETSGRGVRGVRLADGTFVASERIVAALPAVDVARLCPAFGERSREMRAGLPERWGAFMLYCGLPPGVVPAGFPTHHQLVFDETAPLGEGNSAFISFSSAGDRTRARAGGRAVTLSTHTDVARWERAYRDGRHAEMRDEYARRLTGALDRILPGASQRADVVEAADPHTFRRYTGRHRGLVGGLPQTSLLGTLSHRTRVRGLYLAGDTTFPGQSTVGVTLGALNAARAAAPGRRAGDVSSACLPDSR